MTNELQLGSLADATAALGHAQRAERAASVSIALSILAMVDLAKVDEAKLFDGAERWVMGGSDGTPRIAEFIVGEIACQLDISPASAFGRVASLLNLRHRHPSLFRLGIEGDVAMWEVLRVADACSSAKLSAEACARFDQLCATALRYQPWSRVRTQIDRWILSADPALAAEREAAAAACRQVGVGRIEDGHCSIGGQVDAADGVAFDEALDQIASTLPEGDRNHRRAAALGVLSRAALGQEPLALGGDAADKPGSGLGGHDARGARGLGRASEGSGLALPPRQRSAELVDPGPRESPLPFCLAYA